MLARLTYAIFIWGLFLTFKLYSITPLLNLTPIHEAFVTKFTDITPAIAISSPPPLPIEEIIPPRPSHDTIWIPGYWAWIDANSDFAWVCGVWRRPPPDQQWIPGAWFKNQNKWTWLQGFWSPMPLEKLTYIDVAPPNAITDQVPKAPNKDYFWIPGYWEYSTSNKKYTWLSGKWEPFNSNWIITPATYIWRPSGYVFIPLNWDWPLEARGKAYACSNAETQAPIFIESTTLIQQLLIYYPDYVCVYWHWWHFHPGWWGECWCIPPWWFWHDWWCFSWCDLWGIWWWWGHPGALPPAWISLELSMKIAPPTHEMIDFFKKIHKPPFKIKSGDKPLLPTGPLGIKDLPKPNIPTDVHPGGQITPPSIPMPPTPPRQVTPPPPPTYTPPTDTWQPPVPQPSYPPQAEPPVYYPPRHPQKPDYPPRPPSTTYPRIPPQYPPTTYPKPPRPSNTNPPSTTSPRTPPPSSTTNPKYPPSTTYPRTPSSKSQIPEPD